MAMVVAKSNEGYKCDYGMMADPIGGGAIAPPCPILATALDRTIYKLQ